MATTVITCPGAFSSYDTNNFGGDLFASPNTWVEDPLVGSWNNWTISNGAATTDMNDMYDLIIEHQATSDWLVVAGHSRGAQIIYKLIREKMTDLNNNVDPETILFISSGNPERKYGGRSVINYAGATPVYPGTQPYGNGYGLPDTASPTGDFRLLDIARQYDEWADYPNDFGNTTAMDNLDTAGNIHSEYENAPHLGLDGFPVDWGQWARYDEGNVSYLTSTTPYTTKPRIPLLVRLFGGRMLANYKAQIVYREAQTKAAVEVAYTRPAPLVSGV